MYFRNILTSINTYREKTPDMIKLKTHLRNTLIFFHLYWNDIKEVLLEIMNFMNLIKNYMNLIKATTY